MRNSRLIGGKPKIGIRPIIDGRRGGLFPVPEGPMIEMTSPLQIFVLSSFRGVTLE